MSEPNKAPVDFFIKMHRALVAKDYSTALNYCNTILSYERTSIMIEFHELLTTKINMMESDSTVTSCSASSSSESDNDDLWCEK